MTPNRPAPVRPERSRAGFFSHLFTTFFNSKRRGEDGAEARKKKTVDSEKPKVQERTADKTPSRPTQGRRDASANDDDRRGGDQKGKRGRGRRRSKKTAKKAATSASPSESPRKKQRSKKRGQKKAKKVTARTDSPKAAEQSARPDDNPSSPADSAKSPPDQPRKQTAADDQDGNRPETAPRRGRRRRSPYQTAGSKQRDGTEAKPQQETKPQAQSEPDVKPQAQPQQDAKPQPQQDAKPPPQGGSAETRVSQDNKGIYTLKPSGPGPQTSVESD
jgi:hypothetical protein